MNHNLKVIYIINYKMEESTKKMLFGFFFVLLGISLFIMSILDIRTYQDSDNQTIKDNIDSINTFSHIVIGVSVFIVLTGIILMIRSKRPDFLDFFFRLSPKIAAIIMGVVGVLILSVGIAQRAKINNILPDMSNETAVKSYNDNHTVSASAVLGSNMGIIASGIMFLLAGIVHYFMNREVEVEEPPQQIIKSKARLQYEKGKAYTLILKKELDAEIASGRFDESYLNEKELIYENADAAVEKAWADYKKGIEDALTQSQNVKAAVQASAVGSPLATPVSGQQQQVRGGLDFPPPLRRL